MPFSNRQLLDSLGRTPFVDSTELALILGEPHATVHRRGRFDATVTLHDGRSFGVVRQGLALRRRAIAEYDYSSRPDTVLILVPSVWEERLTTRFCEDRTLRLARSHARRFAGHPDPRGGERATGFLVV